MERSNLVRADAFRMGAGAGARVVVGLVAVCGATALAGCHSSAAGGRPSDAGMMDAPPLVEKLPTPDAYCAPDAVEVSNQCPLNFCGFPKSVKTLAVGEVAQLGTDSVCTPGTVCVPAGPTTAGDALALRCAQPFAPAAATIRCS